MRWRKAPSIPIGARCRLWRSPRPPRARIVAGTTAEDIAILSSGPRFARLASDPARPMAT
jgi:hypothetical protein